MVPCYISLLSARSYRPHLISPLHQPVTQKVNPKVTKSKAQGSKRHEGERSRKPEATGPQGTRGRPRPAEQEEACSSAVCVVTGHWLRPPGEGVFVVEAVLRKVGLRCTASVRIPVVPFRHMLQLIASFFVNLSFRDHLFQATGAKPIDPSSHPSIHPAIHCLC